MNNTRITEFYVSARIYLSNKNEDNIIRHCLIKVTHSNNIHWNSQKVRIAANERALKGFKKEWLTEPTIVPVENIKILIINTELKLQVDLIVEQLIKECNLTIKEET